MSNIELRINTYHAVLIVPKDVRDKLGRTKYRQSLNTGDKKEAIRKAAYYVTLWKNEIETARGNKGALAEDLQKWQTYFDIQKQSIIEAPANDDLKAGMVELETLYISHLNTLEAEKAEALHGLIKGTKTLTAEHFDNWKNQLDLVPKTIDQMTRDVQGLVNRFDTLEEITKTKVLEMIRELEEQGKGISTIKRLLFSYRNYWYYLQDKDIVKPDHDPFSLQNILKGKIQRANKKKIKRKAFTDLETVKMWDRARAKEDYQLADLIALGAYTGARIEEICSIKLSDIGDGYFAIGEAKTEAGNRNIPIHNDIINLVDRLKKDSKDGYLLTELTRNKYGDRSNAIGKRFGRLKTAEGCDKSLVFHSLRKTLITLLENAGIPENFACDIVGHEKGTMTYGHYSGGTSLDKKREAINKITYPFPVPLV